MGSEALGMTTAAARINDGQDLACLLDSAKAASVFLKALSNENRLLLLCLLAEGERSVTELETLLDLRQPTVSQQLARLRAENLVSTRRDGKTARRSITRWPASRRAGSWVCSMSSSVRPVRSARRPAIGGPRRTVWHLEKSAVCAHERSQSCEIGGGRARSSRQGAN